MDATYLNKLKRAMETKAFSGVSLFFSGSIKRKMVKVRQETMNGEQAEIKLNTVEM